MKRIVIADDHSVVRQGLIGILSETEGYSVVGEASSVQDLMKVLSSQAADAVVLDLSMPGGGGLEALKLLKVDHSELPVLILSFHAEEQYGLRAFKAGASGYLSKECAPDQLMKALHKITSGRRYFSKKTEDLIFNNLEKKSIQKNILHENLSDRELLVFTLLGEGKTLTEISTDIAISVNTVSTYRQRLLKKMQMKTNAEIAIYAVTHGLIPHVSNPR